MTFHNHHAPRSAVSSPAVRQPGPVTRAIRGLRPNEAPTWEQRQREIDAEERAAMRALRRRIAKAVTVAIDFLDRTEGDAELEDDETEEQHDAEAEIFVRGGQGA